MPVFGLPARPARLAALALALPAGALALAPRTAAQPQPIAAGSDGGPARAATAPGADEAAYDEARGLLDARLYPSAQRAFEAYRARYPEGPRAPEALFHEAESALAADDATTAGALFARFRARYPAHPLAPRAALAVGERALAQGDPVRAEAAFREALDGAGLDPTAAARVRYLAGLATREQGRTAEALADFDAVAADPAAGPVAPQALYAAGALRAGQADWDGAAADWERLAAEHPESPENVRVGGGLGEAYARLGRFDDAALELARRRPALTGDETARADFLLGDALVRLGRAGDAAERLEAVPAESPYGRRARFGRARLAYDARDYADAAGGFAAVREAPGEGPDGADDALAHEATFYEGLALKRTGDLAEAERRLAAATLRRPDGAFADAALLELGLLRIEGRRPDEAAESFEALLRDYPRSAHAGEAARLLGEAYTATGDRARAREAVRRAESLGTASPELAAEVDFQDAYALYTARRFDEAAEGFLGVFRRDEAGERAGEALFWAGEALFQAAEYGRAEETLTDFLARFPGHGQADPARYVLAWTHFKRRDYARAAVSFERFLAAYRTDEETVPYVADARLRLADSYYALGRYEDAAAAYGRVEGATSDDRGTDYALFQTGQAWAAAERTDDALAAWDRILTEFPDSPLRAQALVARGVLLSQTGDDAEALAAFERVLAERPQDPFAPRALVGIGDVQFNAGRSREAEAAYRRVLEAYPTSPLVAEALDGLGAALAEQGRQGELADALAAYEARNPDPAARDRLRLRQAELAVEGGDAEAALARLEALADGSADPDVPPRARFALGQALSGLGRPAEAAAAYARVPAGHAIHAEAVLRQGEALLADNDAAGSARVLATFETRFPEDAELIGAALLAEARALDALGRSAEADTLRARLLDAFSDTAAAAEARAAPPGGPAPAEDEPNEDEPETD